MSHTQRCMFWWQYNSIRDDVKEVGIGCNMLRNYLWANIQWLENAALCLCESFCSFEGERTTSWVKLVHELGHFLVHWRPTHCNLAKYTFFHACMAAFTQVAHQSMIMQAHHWSLRMSKQMAPVTELMFGCHIFVTNFTCGYRVAGICDSVVEQMWWDMRKGTISRIFWIFILKRL